MVTVIAFLGGIVVGIIICLIWACLVASASNQAYELNENVTSGAEKPKRAEVPKKPINLGMVLIPLLILTASCIPSTTPEPEIIERRCTLPTLDLKPSVPAIDWVQNGVLMCVDPENYFYLKQRESLIKTDSNYCRKVYNQAQERCGQ